MGSNAPAERMTSLDAVRSYDGARGGSRISYLSGIWIHQENSPSGPWVNSTPVKEGVEPLELVMNSLLTVVSMRTSKLDLEVTSEVK